MACAEHRHFTRRPEDDWRARAACRGNTEPFFPPDSNEGPLGLAAREARAKAICATCPVIEECLDFALTYSEYGYWGGTNEAERRQMRRAG